MLRRKLGASACVLGAALTFAATAGADGQPPPPNDNDNGNADRTAVCHKPGTPAQKVLYVPQQAHPGHGGHGDPPSECEGDGE